MYLLFSFFYLTIFFRIKGHAMPIRALCFSPDSQVLASASDDCHIRLHDM
jgi:WD40 repeat protein